MSKLITSKFRTHIAAQFLESFSETSNTIYYLGAHKSMPYTDDTTPPSIINSVKENYYTTYDDLVFGKHITPADVKHMIRNVAWESGTVYDIYDDTAQDLEIKNFYVHTKEGNTYSVFKCLGNNGGLTSTSSPLLSETSPEDEIYKTADGYQWKYMYSISVSEYNKFATNSYIPVIPNANVSGNAISGSISTILIENPGSQYNSYASGTIQEAAASGDPLLYTLSSDKFAEYDVTVANAAIFTEGKVTSSSNNKTSTGVIVAIFTANNTLRISNVNRAFVPGANLTSSTNSSITSNIISSSALTIPLSTNSNFYNGSSFYIRSGKGAGQLRTIMGYSVISGQKQIIINSPLEILPDSTSIFEIGPRIIINGDGVNANAIAIIDPTSNSISEVEIVDSGSNYTYADITVIANTGNIATGTNTFINTSNARLRAIIPPKGGHGYDAINELYATRIGIGVSMRGSEGSTIPATNDYRKISIIKDPLLANVELTLTYANGSAYPASNFSASEYIIQANSGAKGQITNRSGDTLRLTNVTGFFNSGNTGVYEITGNSSGATAVVSSIDRSFDTFDQRQIYNISIVGAGPSGVGFALDEMVSQSGLLEIESDIVKLTINQSAYVYNDGELITQYNGANTTANGIIISRYGNILEVNPNFGSFVSGNSSVNYIVGSETDTISSVSNADNTVIANGVGYIHSLNANGTSSTQVGLSGVKGNFNTFGSINTFVGQTNGATANIISRSYTIDSVNLNSLIDGSGEFMYIENFAPVIRNVDQTEKIKLIIEF